MRARGAVGATAGAMTLPVRAASPAGGRGHGPTMTEATTPVGPATGSSGWHADGVTTRGDGLGGNRWPWRSGSSCATTIPSFAPGSSTALAAEPDLELVGEAGTLRDLRERVRRTAADLVILDVELPDGPAIDAVAEIADEAAVVVISAHDHAELVRRALRDGALGYIRKDAEPAEVLRLVRRAAEGKTALSADMALRLAESLRVRRDKATVDHALASLSRASARWWRSSPRARRTVRSPPSCSSANAPSGTT